MVLMELLKELETMETNVDLATEITGVFNDSRRVIPGSIFVAIAGSLHDGHLYIPKALENGAVLVVSEQPLHTSVPYIVVPDTKEALARLGAAFMGHPARRMTMVGVTGTNGKTTTTHLLYELFNRTPGCVAGLIGTNHILYPGAALAAERTTPDAVALQKIFRDMADAGCTHCVMEVSSHALEQKRVAGITYEAAAFTNLTQDHLDYHGTMDNYFEAKRILFEQCGHAVVNMDDKYGAELKNAQPCLLTTFSIDAPSDLQARDVHLAADGVSMTVEWQGETARLTWGTPARFSVYNVLTAVGIALRLGLKLEDIARELVTVPPICGRMEVVPVPADFTVVIDYAHTPDALENVLETMVALKKGRLITVFGCGGDRDNGKRPLMGGIAARLSDLAVVTSDNPRTEKPEKIIEQILAGMPDCTPIVEVDRRAAIHRALAMAQAGDVIMICGKGHEMYQEINGVTYPMDERELVAGFWRAEND